MPRRILNSIEHLPRPAADGGQPPSSNPFILESFAEHWREMYVEQGRHEKGHAIPEAGPYRGSMAGMRCDRELYYALTDTPRSDPPTVADEWRWYLGQIVHEAIQPAVLAMYPGAEEVKHDLRVIGIPGSSHSDLVTEIDGHRVLVELKTVNGFKFKMMATRFNGPPEGPSYGAVMQALLSAKAEEIDRVVIFNLSLENLSPSTAYLADSAAGRFSAEWHYTVTEMSEQIDAEIRRIKLVLRHVDNETPPPRELHDPEYPVGAIVTDPKGRPRAPWSVRNEADQVTASGDYWGCGYCPWQEHCKGDE